MRHSTYRADPAKALARIIAQGIEGSEVSEMKFSATSALSTWNYAMTWVCIAGSAR